ncbi:MAG: SPOR domain-containing protein [Tannerella sp.]|jgi:hypothetical protein|nr:SPOR domain-containing protein [Tannerella sp.]
MLEIAIHIERLLPVNDCVIIPDFGGFVLQNCPAVHERDAHLFRPSHKEIVFNPTLKHDDGLIAGAYMQAYGMTFNQARAALKKDVESLKAVLDERREVTLDAIGTFRREADGAVVFHPVADCARFSLSSYGLAPFHLPPVPAEAHPAANPTGDRPKPDRKSAHVIYLPVNRTLAGIAGVFAAAVALSLVIMTPLEEVNPASYTASFAPAEIVKKITLPAGTTAADGGAVADGPGHAETEAKAPASLPVEQLNGSKPAKTYYAIIGSFETENQARTFIGRLDTPSLRSVGIVRQDKRIRVFAGRYESRSEAEDCIAVLRKEERFRDAWLFAGR